MTNVVSRDGYNIPKLIYDGSLASSSVTVGDAEDFARFKDQVAKSGIFVIKRTDPTQAESFFFASVDSPTSVIGYRLYTTPTGPSITLTLITISLPSTTPNEMKYIGVNKTITAT